MNDRFDNISPMDYRYVKDKRILDFLSENARIKYQLKVELALVKTLSKKGICSEESVREVEKACEEIKAEEVYKEEERIRHDVRALVNSIRKRVADKTKPFIHMGATSYDIVNTADSLRFKEFTMNILIPYLKELEKTLIDIARREKDTLQIGRTHGQHAEPITFGFAIAEYVSRLGNRICEIEEKANNLKGKMSGAVGSYNSTSLFFENPEEYEIEVLKELGLEPSTHSTQIVEPEFLTDFIHSVLSCLGVLANLADDMRHLQRTEIAEVGEAFSEEQVGSSTMPQKRNPINFENIKSLWKVFAPRITTLYLDQVSEHQRDLTNSASSRFIPEILASLFISTERLDRVMKKIGVDNENMRLNFERSREMIIAEPLYLLLAYLGHDDAHEAVRRLTLETQKSGKSLFQLAQESPSIKIYMERLSEKQLNLLKNPEKYTGIASKKANNVCSFWEKKLNLTASQAKLI